MNRSSPFSPPAELENRRAVLKERDEFKKQASQVDILLQVELGFALMEKLGFADEPITAVWAILSGMPLRHPRLQSLSKTDRRAIANARQLVAYSARSSWLNALQDYLEIPLAWRNYDFALDPNSRKKNEPIIAASKTIRQQNHQLLYELCLSCLLSRHVRNGSVAKPDTLYQFYAETEVETQPIRIRFPAELTAASRGVPLPALSLRHAPFAQPLDISELQQVADFFDERENKLAQQYNYRETATGQWGARFRKLEYRRVMADGTLCRMNELPIDGFVHLAGMVASGKSTLALLIAGYLILKYPEKRMTLVVGDVQTALRLANMINWWFRDNPEADKPVAVPLLGHSTRGAHLQGFYASKDCQEYQERGQIHWGERWLGTVCPLQALISSEDLLYRLEGRPIKPGSEPCHSLQKVQVKKNGGESIPATRHDCLFFTTCPSHQAYRDMADAAIWITTPGALAQGSVPVQFDSRSIKMGELVYEQSDLVIFDEADMVLNWFDQVYAEDVPLANGHDGVLDSVNIPTEGFMNQYRVQPQPTKRWVSAERESQKGVEAVLTLLDPRIGPQGLLSRWVARGYFTPNTLFYKLARRLSGLEEFDPPGTTPEVRDANAEATAEVFRWFTDLLEITNPLTMQVSTSSEDPTDYLALIVQRINTLGDSGTNIVIHTECKSWIEKHCPDIEDRLKRLASELEQRKQQSTTNKRKARYNVKNDEFEVDTVKDLAYRLQFALTVALLDAHNRVVFYEWQNRPFVVEGETPHRRMPTTMLDVLPLPLTGRQFGTYYAPATKMDGGPDEHKRLSLFAYTNIGRSYVLNFHQLLTDLDGCPGPSVLALSGTSYLPGSTQMHVSKPAGLLMPEEAALNAIEKSHFEFLPQYSARDDKPIRISGRPIKQKRPLFDEVMRELAGKSGSGHLDQELTQLRQLGIEQPAEWADRARLLLLVNSYEQAYWARQSARECLPALGDKIYYLVSDKQSTEVAQTSASSTLMQSGALLRADVETFAATKGSILIAPLGAIGRGHNILNSAGKAAFGSVYFLTRPYPYPHDVAAIAREMNYRALEWAADPDFVAWQEDGISGRADAVRRLATFYWQMVEQRSYYHTLYPNRKLRAYPRQDLAATIAGLIVQAVGRLVRGGVPFRAYFVDAAWAPNWADRENRLPETPSTSLLAAMIEQLVRYADSAEDVIGAALYAPLANALLDIKNFQWRPSKKEGESDEI